MARPRGDFEKGCQETLRHLKELPPGVKWPSNEWLAKKAGVVVRTIQRRLKALEAAGHLKRMMRHFRKAGRWLTQRLIDLLDATKKKTARFGRPIYVENDKEPLISEEDRELFAREEEAEKARKAKMADPEFRRQHNEIWARRQLAHEQKGGYSRPVKHSPQVQAILRLLERRLAGENV